MASERSVFLTGAWLGAAQASLGFALLVGAGASALVYFALLAGWIASGALGAVARSRDLAHFVAALLAIVATRMLANSAPFSTVTFVVGVLACVACGSYAGFFIASAGSRANNQRRFLLVENNGFVLGFAVASLLLFVSVRVVDALVALGGGALLATKVRQR